MLSQIQFHITKHLKRKMYTYWAMVEGWFCLKMTLCIRVLITAAPSLLNFLIHGLSGSTTPTPSQWTRLTDYSARGVIRIAVCDWRRLYEQRLDAVHWLSGFVPPSACSPPTVSEKAEVNEERDFSWWTLRPKIDFVEHSCITIVMCVTYEMSTNWLIIK